MRALTTLFVILVLLPGVVLAWLGWQSTSTFEGQARDLARREALAVAAQVSLRAAERAVEIERSCHRAAAVAAGVLRRRLPVDSAGSVLTAAWRSAAAVLGHELARHSAMRLVGDEGRVLLPAPAVTEDLSDLREGPEFTDRRRHAERLEFIAGRPLEAARLLERLGDDLATVGLEALAWSHAARTWQRAGNPDRAGAVLAKVRALDHTRALAGGPMVVEAQLASGVGVDWVRRAARAGLLASVPAADTVRRSWWRRIDLEPPAWLAAGDGSARYAVRDAIAKGAQIELSISFVPLWSAVVPGEIGGMEILSGDGAREGDVPVTVEALGASAPFAVRNPALDDLASRSAVRRSVTAAAIGGLLLLMVLGVLLVRRAIAREEAARRLREDFIANVSHELRTPLTSIRMHAEMLAEAGLDDGAREEYGAVVEAEGARLASLVDDLLDFAALAQGRRRLEPSPVDLAAVVRDTAAAWRPLAEREGVTLLAETNGEEPAFADPTALSRILANLMQNALRHGRPARDGEAPRVLLRSGPGPVLEIRDNGPGVPHDDRATVFERFHRGVAATNQTGAGIGLSLSRELARAQGGDLVADDDGETVFRLTLPPVPAQPDTGAADD